MNVFLGVILAIIFFRYLLNLTVDFLNLRAAAVILPDEFKGYYDEEKYKKAQYYLREKTNFGIFEETVSTVVTVCFILAGGFDIVDQFARGFGFGKILTGIIFCGVLMLIAQAAAIPFSAYNTFVIEEKFGFNRTAVKTFILDILKSLVLGALIGGAAFAGILWFFERAGGLAWLYCWIAVSLFELLLLFIAPVVFLPLFNKFFPLAEGELKRTLENYAAGQNFALQGIFTMDGSKRSTKSNAFFTGFGRFRRIALFDTLIDNHNVDELVSVLAHEIGHYKKKHVLKHIGVSILTTGLMFLVMSFFLNNRGLFEAFKMREVSIYAGLVFFGFLYAPINMIFSIAANVISRKHEYEADNFSVTTYKKPQAFINALKKLSVNNLSNLTPHPLKVFLFYSHPPVLKRIQAIRDMQSRHDCDLSG
ncbi:MAG: M48 family metallopeptidase [Candidatus Omnitrophica bacterium]|nr:M48 family metallopeptidase [Candidatus Omnitrophota bacterium]